MKPAGRTAKGKSQRNESVIEEDVISIAMATYNSSRYLREQLESVIAQTRAPAEIVVSDDGSTDDTLAILAEYAQCDRRIAIFHNRSGERNRINRNFENAARRCTGSWVAFCDHDDIWLPDKLEVLYSNRHGAPLVYGRSELVDAAGRPMGMKAQDHLGFPRYFSGAVSPYILINANTVSGHAMIVRRTVIDAGLPFPDSIMFDQWLALVAACRGKIRFVDESVVLHRIHTENSVHHLRTTGNRHRSRITAPDRYRGAIDRKSEILLRLWAFEADLEPADRAFLDEYLEHLRRAPSRYFDLRFLLAGFTMRRRLYPQKFAWRLFKECIGGRWYGA